MRTVLWQFADLPFTDHELKTLENLDCELTGLITDAENLAMDERVANLLRSGKFPLPPTDWPAIPWPPF